MQLKPMLGLLTAGLLGLTMFAAEAAQPPWSAAPFSYFATNDDIGAILRSFAANQGMPVVISDKVKGTVNGRFTKLAPAEFLRRLVAAYGLTWYYDGHVLYVYSADEMRSRVVRLNFYPVTRFQQTLQQLDIIDERFTFKPVADEGIVFVSGPEPFVNLVEDMGKALDGSFPVKATAQSDAIYQWVDENNGVHYSSKPPPQTALLIKTVDIEPTAAGRVSGAAEMHKRVADYTRYLQALDGVKPAPVSAGAVADPSAKAKP